MILSTSSEETQSIGVKIGKKLKAGSVICIHGDLGAGKTTLVKGIIFGINDTDPDLIQSPTFTYVNSYEPSDRNREALTVHHFDLYRIKDEKEFDQRGFSEFFTEDAICLIEWPERINHQSFDQIHLEYMEENQRKITLKIQENARI